MRVAFVIYDGFQGLDLTGPYEVMQATGRYECLVVGPQAGPVTSSSGLPVVASHGVGGLPPEGFDTVLVAGGSGVDRAREDPALVRWVTDAARDARRLGFEVVVLDDACRSLDVGGSEAAARADLQAIGAACVFSDVLE